MKRQEDFQQKSKKTSKPKGPPCRANADTLARSILARAQERADKQNRNKTFTGEDVIEQSRESAAARERIRANRRRVREEMLAVREKYPEATECEIYTKLIESNAHPMTIAAQKIRLEKAQKGLPLPELNPDVSPLSSPEPSVERESIEELSPELLYSRPYTKQVEPFPESHFSQEAAEKRIKETRETVARELREVRETYPQATECEILTRLIEGGAHPQTISVQQERVKRLRGQKPPKPEPPCTPKSPPRQMSPRILFIDDDPNEPESSIASECIVFI